MVVAVRIDLTISKANTNLIVIIIIIYQHQSKSNSSKHHPQITTYFNNCLDLNASAFINPLTQE